MTEELNQLKEKLERKKRIERDLDILLGQAETLTRQADGLKREKYNERFDVERLEGRSLRRLILTLTGRYDDALDKEKREAMAAEVRYDAVAAQLNALNERIDNDRMELSRLQSAEHHYERALKSALEKAKSEDPKLAELDERAAGEERLIRELDEAISAGEVALNTAERMIKSLESAQGYATWDVFGGGLIADLAKHDRLDSAQEEVERLQVQLRRFETELADVELVTKVDYDIDGMLKFADFFCDGLIVDLLVADRISKSLESVRDTRSHVAGILHELKGRRETAHIKYSETKAELESSAAKTNER